VLTAEEAVFTNRPEDLVRALPEFVRTRFGAPLPPWSSARSGMVSSDGPADQIGAAMAKADTRLLALVGMTALVPGSIRPELEQIDVPTLVALGEDDIAGDIAALPGQLPACRDCRCSCWRPPDTTTTWPIPDSISGGVCFVGSIRLRLRMPAIDRPVSSHIPAIGPPSDGHRMADPPCQPVIHSVYYGCERGLGLTDRPGEGRMRFDGQTASTGPEEVRDT
jgi:hypothetical protein